MPKLHELTAAYAHLEPLIDDEATDNTTLCRTFDDIKDALQQKSENVGKLIQNLESTADAMKAAEGRLATRRKVIENRAKAIRNYLLTNMVNSSILSIECEYFKIVVRDNPPSVIIDEGVVLPDEYLRTLEPPSPVPDKKKLLEDLKQGVILDGIRIERGKRIDIK